MGCKTGAQAAQEHYQYPGHKIMMRENQVVACDGIFMY